MIPVFLILVLVIAMSSTDSAVADPPESACVVLLHGMGRTARSMEPLARALSEDGFRVVNHDYRSRHVGIRDIASQEVPRAIARCGPDARGPVHFVTHSLGGIVVRAWLQHAVLPPGSRIVMIAPPNQGSEVADRLAGFAPFDWIFGTTGRSLGIRAGTSVPLELEPIDAPVGVIAGNRTLEPWLSWMFPGPNDGKVSVARARLAEMDDFVVVPSSHGFIMRSPETIAQTIRFLRTGRFLGGVSAPESDTAHHRG